MYQYNQYNIKQFNIKYLTICVHMYQISDHTNSLTIVEIETKKISGDTGSNIIITLYLICKRLNVTKRHSL